MSEAETTTSHIIEIARKTGQSPRTMGFTIAVLAVLQWQREQSGETADGCFRVDESGLREMAGPNAVAIAQSLADQGYLGLQKGHGVLLCRLPFGTDCDLHSAQTLPNTDLFGEQIPSGDDAPRRRKRRFKPEDKVVERIYAEYPRKVGKGNAKQAIAKALNRRQVTPETLLEATRAYAELVQSKLGITRRSAEYRNVPHPATWYNDERYWEDEDEWRNRLRWHSPDNNKLTPFTPINNSASTGSSSPVAAQI